MEKVYGVRSEMSEFPLNVSQALPSIKPEWQQSKTAWSTGQ